MVFTAPPWAGATAQRGRFRTRRCGGVVVRMEIVHAETTNEHRVGGQPGPEVFGPPGQEPPLRVEVSRGDLAAVPLRPFLFVAQHEIGQTDRGAASARWWHAGGRTLGRVAAFVAAFGRSSGRLGSFPRLIELRMTDVAHSSAACTVIR
jgi:hypothetical protein